MPSSAGRRPGRQNTRAPAPGGSSPAKPAGPVTPELLQQRWDAARRSAQQPGQSRADLLGLSQQDLQSQIRVQGLQIAIGHGVHPATLPVAPLGGASICDAEARAWVRECTTQPVHKPGVQPVESPPANTSLDHLTVGQLRAEIGQMEKFVKDCENKTSPPCVLMQQTLVSYRQALAGCKSVGLRLDAAAQKHAAATKAREVAEAQLSSARRAVTQAEQALAQARQAESEAEQAHNDLRVSVQDAPPAETLPPDVSAAVLNTLAGLGLQPCHLATLTQLLGNVIQNGPLPVPTGPNQENPPPPGDVSMEGDPGDQDGADGPAKRARFIGPVLPSGAALHKELLPSHTQATQVETPQRERSPRRPPSEAGSAAGSQAR